MGVFLHDYPILSFAVRTVDRYTVVPATSGHLRYGAKVAPRGRWPPDTETLTRQRLLSVSTLQKWPAKAGGHSPKGPAVAGTTVVPVMNGHPRDQAKVSVRQT